MFRYSVHGLDLTCDTPLPELEQRSADDAQSGSIDVRLKVAHRGYPRNASWFRWSSLPSGERAMLGRTERGYLMRFVGLADFAVNEARRELRCVRCEAGTSPETLRRILLHQALPPVLSLAGHDVLHAAAVLTPHGLCAFIGPAGAGKSTLAASFVAAGCAPFSDDCLVVRLEREVLALPGCPSLRLWSDSLAALQRQQPGFHDVAGFNPELRAVGGAKPAPGRAHPLAAIYRIARAGGGDARLSAARIEPLSGAQAFLELAASNYVLNVGSSDVLRRHFCLVDQLIARVRVRRLEVPNNFAFLPSVRRAILDDLHRN